MNRRTGLAAMAASGVAVAAAVGSLLVAGAGAASAAPGALTDAQKRTIAAIAEEEKLAHDLYAEFADRYGVRIFSNIGTAETRHMAAVRGLLDTYGIADPTAGKAPGVFADPAVQDLYDRLLEQGETGLRGALESGLAVEIQDIADLTEARKGLTAPDVKQVYSNLLAASENHKNAFTNWLYR
jgi:hypothetical protein